MKALDLCAGAGGLSLGLMCAGFDVLGVEKWEPAVATHVQNVGSCVRQSIESFHPETEFALVAGGIPCQPFSDMSTRLGMRTHDGRLFEHVIRIAKEANARAIMIENVRGFITWGKGAALDRLCLMLLEANYFPVWKLIDCSKFGLAQARKRLILVALRIGEKRFIWPEERNWSVTVREVLSLTGSYYVGLMPPKRRDVAKYHNGRRCINPDSFSPTITAKVQDYLWRVGDLSPKALNLQQMSLLQGFPSSFVWEGNSLEKRKQIANAVPPPLALIFGNALREALT